MTVINSKETAGSEETENKKTFLKKSNNKRGGVNQFNPS